MEEVYVPLPRRADGDVQFLDNARDKCFRVAKKHERFVHVVQVIIDTGEARTHAALNHKNGVRVTGVEDRHTGDRAVLIVTSRGVYDIIRTTVVGFTLALEVVVLLAAIGAPVHMDRLLFAAMGLLFVVLGNFMGKVTKNFFVGIRTPWTLASDEVWLRTHRLGGKLFVVAGIGLLVCALLGVGFIAMMVALAVAGGIPVVYSYLLYRRLDGHAP